MRPSSEPSGSPPQENPPLASRPAFPCDPQSDPILNRIAHSFHTDFHTQEDLEQEIRLHFWLKQLENPDQTLSWYHESSRFHALAYLRRGHSIDSPKNSHLQQFEDDSADPDCEQSPFAQDETVTSTVSARDILSLLRPCLDDFRRKVLDLLDHGYSSRDIAGELHRSQSAVTRARKSIAALLQKFGIHPTEK